MESQLFSLSKIFTERLFRIPDYQRGYAWTEPQWKDFWTDLEQIEEGQNHYTGVLTLETVPPENLSSWHEDRWIMESRGYEPFYVVDGQQRMTTAILLIQAILDGVEEGQRLNYTDQSDIRRKFIFESKDQGISRSYIFGYDKDNPSYEFLKTRIFGEFSSTAGPEETIYTNNLETAKGYFRERIANRRFQDTELIYKKVTQHLLFNIFTISREVEVCVAFETMNNRGKPLSDLELLKNRLIYLSLKVEESDPERDKLRRSVNDCWKSIYHNLGRNKARPLEDDLFLNSHYFLYFLRFDENSKAESEEEFYRYLMEQRRILRKHGDYSKLLEEIFVPRRLRPEEPEESRLRVKHIYEYVSSLQTSVAHWYDIFNPLENRSLGDAALWLDKLDRLGNRSFLPLILAVLHSVKLVEDRVLILHRLERLIFLSSLMEYSTFRPYFEEGFIRQAVDLYTGRLDAKQVASVLKDAAAKIVERKNFLSDAKSAFRSRGFYNWRAIKYFLYEYNLDLQHKSKTERRKINWPEYIERRPDYATVEHIYPQNARQKYWTDRFSNMSQKQRELLRNSLGNLLPLSQPKNASLSNRPFPDKLENEGGAVGFRYGSYAENEVAKEVDWTPKHIEERGLRLLAFMEKRWSLQLGNVAGRREMLGVDFLPE